MAYTRDQIYQVLEELGIRNWMRNAQVMGNDIILDIVSPSPAMHERKRLEIALKNAFKENLPEANLKLNISVEVEEKNPNEIKGSELPGVKNIIAVASGKGGVGKSTVSSNLAISLANMGFKVGLLDADIYGPSMPIMFDCQDARPYSVEVNGKTKIKPVESYGIKILSIGFFADTDQAIVWRGPMAAKALNQMIRDAHWGDLDFLLIDLPPGTGDIHLSIVQQVPITGAVVVSTPQNIALADAKKGVGMFQMEAINVPVLGIVENMAYFTPKELPNNKYYIFGQNGAKDLAEQIGVPFLGEIPIVQSIREAADVGRPAAMQEDTVVAEVYKSIARNTVQSLVERNNTLPPTEAVRITTMAGCSAKN
ncbi:Mrp/NBP35 family ATP-binding protein [Empedobacter stercoris]|uniref:Iron-sulfur cluster carrier protein n=1 Tax=Empedobacter falsenii TaxID=343874 RepID=A0ABY8V3M2_9FLAO|nr:MULTISPECIES: Mrp/NBP35 family ATP-binding protein [Empedobacter]MDM1522535.1 Mrp/NBP35 family ATP-binding protein [Empedobacter sp. 225-1]MDM1542725.1 Mrp/NBP35 family ATP-binding protein [Empedobacter sp. 189-2]UWX65866.1 Mrp/NBP35 family ATP-binding protein [Empedobacter stercoris]WIH96078.1 Mrp/NBP35 family ATP-binding protein [Empedobacter falsenii]